ncbi:UDP-4-amino-4,6-dideoxy-N-acetyl-beta-L-altrosamine N-acetyltransferase [Bacillus sp. Cr_A10]|uniref:UDP-4-amino-4, 6-dideoxy-N-acetyl-beta-L-altrosamine N-acetyltransferase n=1 Tax=Bacillus sp. Cr_A10 TaxID=3033993 RepID=UPI0023DB5CD8|nr:UDP-4-amino-4,6-dideoxy-N-acetyl-beta-L-altrosamine N-acetyltransferase [Bacillus sp. Cr_A10]MDF2065812.1 UDP-4-amino-4,6-dideoxy-N-acetyl-beta-L-altrosamine N-acetyltransferase [Bacillus sp. Cr_A10]
MNLEERIRLKSITDEDLFIIFKWRNQQSIRNVMINSEIITWNQHISWYNDYKDNHKSITKIFYFDDIPYGVLNVYDIDCKNQKCKWGFYVGELTAPSGMGTILGYTSLNYIFENLKIKKLTAEVLSFNEKSLRFHYKLGFTNEGILREHLLMNNVYKDLYIFVILKEEWDDKKNEILKFLEGRFL